MEFTLYFDPVYHEMPIPRRTFLMSGILLSFEGCISMDIKKGKAIDMAIFSDESGVKYHIPLSQLLNAEGSIKGLIGSSESIGEFLERLAAVKIRVSEIQYVLVPLFNGNMRPKRVLVLDI